MTILCQGGCFAYDGVMAGVAYRHLFDISGRAVDTVASVKNKRLAAHQRTASLLYLF